MMPILCNSVKKYLVYPKEKMFFEESDIILVFSKMVMLWAAM